MRDEGNAEPTVNIVGERVALGPGRRDLLPLFQRWDNDFFAMRTQGGTPLPWTLGQGEAAYDRGGDPETAASFINLPPRGLAADRVHRLERYRPAQPHRHLRDRERRAGGAGAGLRHRGDAPDARLAFTALGLRSVMLTVYEYNLAGLRAYERAGFREFGRLRQA